MSSNFDVNKGRYWQEGIELVSGCTPCSPGCDNCWSAGIAHRFSKTQNLHTSNDGRKYWPFLTDEKTGKFNGRIQIHPERLSRFNTRKPKIFAIWNDLFHEGVPDSFIDECYSFMGLFKNTYLILTKRPTRMSLITNRFIKSWSEMCKRDVIIPHIWHGLTVCNQQEADEKIPIFLQVPGKKFLSIEPMLGAIDLTHYKFHGGTLNLLTGIGNEVIPGTDIPDMVHTQCIDSVILGTETGVKRREMKIEWAESIVDQCDAAGVPSFIKQININGKVSKDMSEWPDKLRRRNLPWL
jgi:protein gp37